MSFCRQHACKTAEQWKQRLQGVADLKVYTYYPKRLKLRFFRYRANWTYMTKAEKQKPAFACPKKMFKRKDYKAVIKGKVFGMTLACGQQLLCHVPTPFTAKDFARLVRERVGPMVEAAYPEKQRRYILMDGEPLLHAPEAVAALSAFGIQAFPDWPGYSPDLNPQENVWPWLGKALRKEERYGDSLGTFRARLTRLSKCYPSPENLVASMTDRVAACLKKKGAMTKF